MRYAFNWNGSEAGAGDQIFALQSLDLLQSSRLMLDWGKREDEHPQSRTIGHVGLKSRRGERADLGLGGVGDEYGPVLALEHEGAACGNGARSRGDASVKVFHAPRTS